MRITNKHGAHPLIVRALEVQDEKWYGGYGEKRFASITELLKPTYLVKQEREHAGELSEEAMSCLWRLFGAAVHRALEELIKDEKDVESEMRLSLNVDGKRVTGGLDALWRDGVITDFKVTSVWKIVFRKTDSFDDWTAQLNAYAEMVRAAGRPVNYLEIVAILRDWDKKNAKRDEDYPQQPQVAIPIELWPPEQVRGMLLSRVKKLQHALESDLTDVTPCTSSDTWEKPTKYAVSKKGRKRALKLFETSKDAYRHVKKLESDENEKGLYVQKRPGSRPRCEGYCSVSEFCPEYARWRNENEAR